MDSIGNQFQLMSLLVAALFGGLAGAIFVQLFNWWRGPVLEVVFRESDRGCAVNTPAQLHDQNGNVTANGYQRYLRIRVNNTGRSTAHDVNLCVTEITFHTSAGSTDIFDEEVLDLPVALSSRITFDLPRDGHRYIDLFCTEDFGNGVEFRFAFISRPARLYLRSYGVGDYSARIFASSDNSASKSTRLSWNWNGSLQGLHIVP